MASRKSPTQSKIASNLYRPTISSQGKQHNFLNNPDEETPTSIANPYVESTGLEKKEHRSEFSFSHKEANKVGEPEKPVESQKSTLKSLLESKRKQANEKIVVQNLENM